MDVREENESLTLGTKRDLIFWLHKKRVGQAYPLKLSSVNHPLRGMLGCLCCLPSGLQIKEFPSPSWDSGHHFLQIRNMASQLISLPQIMNLP